jgi:hypothetical protein
MKQLSLYRIMAFAVANCGCMTSGAGIRGVICVIGFSDDV